MDKFMILDLTLLVLFVSTIGIFLYRNRKKLKKEGLLWLYHTKWGLNLIERTGKKYKKTLNFLSYISVYLGYILMGLMVYLFGRIVWIYAFHGDLIRSIKMPPIMPLVPYLPQMFKLSWLPPFYFSYWIIILAIIAITHEFFHGIFASLNGVKTKTTGFGFFPFFLPVFLAAFVNLDEKEMVKKKNFEQRAVLSAGTFANSLTALLGILLMWGFFALTFSPAGVVYNDYAYEVLPISDITSINGIEFNIDNYNFTSMPAKNIIANDKEYYALKAMDPESGLVALYHDAPAIKSNMSGIIQKIDGIEVDSLDKLSEILDSHSPGEEIQVSLYDGENLVEKEITLEENPLKEGEVWMGISFTNLKQEGVLGKITFFISSYKNPNIYYAPNFEFAQYIYDLLWWLVLISFSVALVNMLPMGIFDGGRFFYLTILKITKSEKIAEKSFLAITKVFLLALLVVMFFWAKNLF